MQGFGYLVAAYAIVWIALFAFLAVLMLRIRGVRTELAAVEQLVREQQENKTCRGSIYRAQRSYYRVYY